MICVIFVMMRCKNIGYILWHKGSEPNSIEVGHIVTISPFSDILLPYFFIKSAWTTRCRQRKRLWRNRFDMFYRRSCQSIRNCYRHHLLRFGIVCKSPVIRDVSYVVDDLVLRSLLEITYKHGCCIYWISYTVYLPLIIIMVSE